MTDRVLRLSAQGQDHRRMVAVVNQHADLIQRGQLETYTVSDLPSADPAGQQVYCSDEAGGGVPVFSDGTNWRRVTDRAIAS